MTVRLGSWLFAAGLAVSLAAPGEARAQDAAGWPAPLEAPRGGWTHVEPVPDVGPIRGFWGPARDDVWAWSGKKLMHWDGTRWTREPSGTTETLRGVHGAGRSVWAVGDGGAFLRRRLAP